MAQSKSMLNDLSHALDLLESENARLLDDNTHLQEVVTDDEMRMRKVLDENAKLRELCADMYIYHNDDCYSCRYHQECADRIDWKCIAPIRLNERARALGIEGGK